MRFFTFLILACVTVISTNAVIIDGPKQSIDKTLCKNLARSKVQDFGKAKSEFKRLGYNTDTIQGQERKLIEALKSAGDYCCESLGTDMPSSENPIPSLIYITNMNRNILLSFKTEKSMIDKYPASNDAAKKFIKNTGAETISFLNCLLPNAAPDRQLEVEKMKSDFISTFTEVQNIYGI